MSSDTTPEQPAAGTALELGPRPCYHVEDFISSQIKKHCKEAGVPVDPAEAQRVIDHLGVDPNYIYDTCLYTKSYFNADHALIRLIEGLRGVHFADAKHTASALGVTLVTSEERGRCLTLWDNHVTVDLDDDECIVGIEGYG